MNAVFQNPMKKRQIDRGLAWKNDSTEISGRQVFCDMLKHAWPCYHENLKYEKEYPTYEFVEWCNEKGARDAENFAFRCAFLLWQFWHLPFCSPWSWRLSVRRDFVQRIYRTCDPDRAITELYGFSVSTSLALVVLNLPVTLMCCRSINVKFTVFSLLQVFFASFS